MLCVSVWCPVALFSSPSQNLWCDFAEHCLLLHLRCDGDHVPSLCWIRVSSGQFGEYKVVDNSSKRSELTVKPAVPPHRSLPPPDSLSVTSLPSSKVHREDDVSPVRDVCRVYWSLRFNSLNVLLHNLTIKWRTFTVTPQHHDQDKNFTETLNPIIHPSR